LFLLKCVGYNNHARFVWFLIVTVAVMSIFILLAVFWALDKYPVKDYKYAELIFEMFWRDCWMLCMVVFKYSEYFVGNLSHPIPTEGSIPWTYHLLPTCS